MINGAIVVNKPKDWTSHDVVAKMRGVYSQKRIGHTGTLDPMATGVLVICLGKATKLVEIITGMEKTYEVEFILGYETDTEDSTGKIIQSSDKKVSSEMIYECISKFIGEQKQLPPMYSAIKIDGKHLYDIAREGKVVERKERAINIYGISEVRIEDEIVKMQVCCSKGTYIRSLVRDIGRNLGTFATMTKLVRTKVGSYSIDQAYSIENIQSNKNDVIINVEELIPNLIRLYSVREADRLLSNGNAIDISYVKGKIIEDNNECLLYDSEGILVGIFIRKGKVLKPKIILREM